MITKKFETYFKTIAGRVPEIAYCAMSDGAQIDRFIEDSLSDNVYPALFFLRPEYKLTDNNADFVTAKYNVIFYLFHKPTDSEGQSIDTAFENAELIIEKLQKELLKTDEHYIGLFSLNDWQAAPVTSMTLDLAVGYEVKCKIELPINEILP